MLVSPVDEARGPALYLIFETCASASLLTFVRMIFNSAT